MALSLQSITAMSDIPPLVDTFAVARGWATIVNGTQRVLTNPVTSFPTGIDIVPTTYGEQLELEADPLNASPPQRFATSQQPHLLGSLNNPDISDPTQLFLFGGTENAVPYIAGVIEFGFNNYRHFYIGGLNKYGTYTGGDVVNSNFHRNLQDDTRYAFNVSDNKMLFSGYQNRLDTEDTGFVRVIETEVQTAFPGQELFEFDQNPTNLQRDGDPAPGRVFGGNGDRVNSVYTHNAQSHFATASLIGPVNIYLALSNSPVRYVPLGYVSGARMINVADIEPGTRVTIAGVNWRVFPEFRRSSDARIFGGVSGGGRAWADAENSHYYGMAYAEDIT